MLTVQVKRNLPGLVTQNKATAHNNLFKRQTQKKSPIIYKVKGLFVTTAECFTIGLRDSICAFPRCEKKMMIMMMIDDNGEEEEEWERKKKKKKRKKKKKKKKKKKEKEEKE